MNDCIYIALDGMSRDDAISLVKKLTHAQGAEMISGYKVHDLWDVYGPTIVADLKAVGAKTVWLDLKLNDTPRTVELRSLAVAKSGADMLSVHVSCGTRALKKAVTSGLKIVAVTVLTSFDSDEAQNIFSANLEETIVNYFNLAKKAGVWGVVLSAHEINLLTAHNDMSLKYVTPGIKERKESDDNQKRVSTPREAVEQGSNYLVIGNEITTSSEPVMVFERIAESIRTL